MVYLALACSDIDWLVHCSSGMLAVVLLVGANVVIGVVLAAAQSELCM